MSFDQLWHERPFAPAPGTPVCERSEIPDGGGRGFTYGEGKNAFELVVVRRDPGLWGYVNVCPHFKVAMNARPDDFVNSKGEIMCSWHYARFRFEDGYCIDGPCEGMSLIPVPILDDGGQLLIGAVQSAPGAG